MRLYQGIVLALAVVLTAGCAANHARAQHEKARLAAIHAAAGPPVGSFNYMVTSMYSWEPLNEHELLIYTRPHQAWLLNVGICPELPYTIAIGLTSHVGQVSSHLDNVVVNGGNFPCTIQKIQPVDVSQLHEQMRQRKGAKVVPATASSSS